MIRISKILAAAVVFHAAAAYANSEPDAPESPAAADSVTISIPSGTVGNYLSSQFARTSGDIDKAIRYLRRAHRNDPQNPNIVGQLQGLLLFTGNIPEAIQLAKNMPIEDQKNSLT